jgi:hypothetical protein
VSGLIFVAGLAALVLIAIYGPRPAGPAGAPSDTFTHVDMKLVGTHLAITPETVPAGLVEISDPGTGNRPAKSWLETLRMLGPASIDNGKSVSRVSVDVVVPHLNAATEPANVITLDVGKNGITSPHRDMRREQPYLPAFASASPPVDRPWTSVAAGQYRLVLRNTSGRRMTCLDRSLRAGAHATVDLSVAPNGPDGSHTYVVTCTGEGNTLSFDLWVL